MTDDRLRDVGLEARERLVAVLAATGVPANPGYVWPPKLSNWSASTPRVICDTLTIGLRLA
jgi:hypothetical protein